MPGIALPRLEYNATSARYLSEWTAAYESRRERSSGLHGSASQSTGRRAARHELRRDARPGAGLRRAAEEDWRDGPHVHLNYQKRSPVGTDHVLQPHRPEIRFA